MSWASWPQGFQRISHPQLKYIYVPDGDTYRQIGEGGGSLALVGNTARPGPGGKQVQFGGGASDGATITRDYALSFTQGITMLVVFRPTASGTKYTLAAAGSGGGEVLQFATNTSGGLQCDAQALANMWSTANLGIAIGGVYCAAITSINGGRTKGFFRGAQVADAATRAGMSGGVTALHFARRGSSGETMNGGIHFVAMGDYMPDAEVRALTRNPFGLYAAPRRSYSIGEAAASGVTGTVNYTNANDTLAASGTTTVTGTLATTNANDTSAASGTTTVAGSLATTNANDTLAASGAVGDAVTGTVSYTNANDTLAAAGTTTVVGALAYTNANDTLASSGTTTVTGALAYTNANDTLAASGAAGAVTGTVDYTNDNDALQASGEAGSGQIGGHFLEKEKPKRKTKTVRESIEEVLSPPTEVIAEQVREALQTPKFDVPDLSDVKARLDRAESILQEQEAIDRRKKRALRLLMLDV
jgi:hypothetical protein